MPASGGEAMRFVVIVADFQQRFPTFLECLGEFKMKQELRDTEKCTMIAPGRGKKKKKS